MLRVKVADLTEFQALQVIANVAHERLFEDAELTGLMDNRVEITLLGCVLTFRPDGTYSVEVMP